MEDRICGWGPNLQFFLDNDEYLKKLKEEIVELFRENYAAATQYMHRYEDLRQFYEADLTITIDDIKQETGK